MSKRTSGLSDLAETMIKQHGLYKAIQVARNQAQTIKDTNRADLWSYVLTRLRDIRDR